MASISVLSPSDSTGAELKGHLLIISAGLEFENLWGFFFFFNWSEIALQCCVGSCCTTV